VFDNPFYVVPWRHTCG